jgi:hypothetical protein
MITFFLPNESPLMLPDRRRRDRHIRHRAGGRPRCGEDEPGGERDGDAESNSGGTGERASQIS